jgi:hypothetical protein
MMTKSREQPMPVSNFSLEIQEKYELHEWKYATAIWDVELRMDHSQFICPNF